MKTPFFWYGSRGFFSTLLWPLGWLYGKGGKINFSFQKPKRFQIPIISIGNIVSGGAGKTPTAIALMRLLEKRGYKVHFVTRGYGGRIHGPLAVDPAYHKACDVGDEPLLLAEHAPTWVAKKRSSGIEKAVESGAQLVILDDGHQTAGCYKDISFIVIDLLQGFGNGCVIPAGPLRENLTEGIKRADGFIGIGYGAIANVSPLNGSSFLDPKPSSLASRFCGLLGTPSVDSGALNLKQHKPFFKAKISPEPLSLPSNRVVAFCGLGFPQKFYTSLKELGIELLATETFPDHYQYKNDDLLRLQELAQKHNSILVTTRKDLIKIPPPWQEQLYVLDIRIDFEESEKVCDYILQKIYSPMEST